MNVPRSILEYVNSKNEITIDDLVENFKIQKISARNYLSRMEREGLIVRVGYGKYERDATTYPSSFISERAKSINEIIRKKMPLADFVIWNTENLSFFTHYNIGKDLTIIEGDKNTIYVIRDVLLENGIKAIVNPLKKEMNESIWYFENPVLLFTRKENYATVLVDNNRVPTIERMITDLYFLITRKELSFPLSEFGKILINVLSKTTLNFDKLNRYAERRNLNAEISLILYELKYKYPDIKIPEEVVKGWKMIKKLLEYVEEIKEVVA